MIGTSDRPCWLTEACKILFFLNTPGQVKCILNIEGCVNGTMQAVYECETRPCIVKSCRESEDSG